jgi:hypothetical protein
MAENGSTPDEGSDLTLGSGCSSVGDHLFSCVDVSGWIEELTP